MAGLNDAWLADDSLEAKQALPVEVFKERAPGTLPEISDHATIIAVEPPVDPEAESEDGIVEKTGEIASVAIEEYQVAMRDLDLFTNSITNAGGMSLSIAQESIALMPGFVNEERPLTFFTKHPSKTQLNAALEAVEERGANMLKVVKEKIAAFIEAIKKRITGFIERVRRIGKTDNQKILMDLSGVLKKATNQPVSDSMLLAFKKSVTQYVFDQVIEGQYDPFTKAIDSKLDAILDYAREGGELSESELNTDLVPNFTGGQNDKHPGFSEQDFKKYLTKCSAITDDMVRSSRKYGGNAVKYCDEAMAITDNLAKEIGNLQPENMYAANELRRRIGACGFFIQMYYGYNQVVRLLRNAGQIASS